MSTPVSAGHGHPFSSFLRLQAKKGHSVLSQARTLCGRPLIFPVSRRRGTKERVASAQSYSGPANPRWTGVREPSQSGRKAEYGTPTPKARGLRRPSEPVAGVRSDATLRCPRDMVGEGAPGAYCVGASRGKAFPFPLSTGHCRITVSACRRLRVLAARADSREITNGCDLMFNGVRVEPGISEALTPGATIKVLRHPRGAQVKRQSLAMIFRSGAGRARAAMPSAPSSTP